METASIHAKNDGSFSRIVNRHPMLHPTLLNFIVLLIAMRFGQDGPIQDAELGEPGDPAKSRYMHDPSGGRAKGGDEP